MEIGSANLDHLVERARNQNVAKNLSWRPYRVSMSEILTMIEDGGELNSWLSFNGKQSVLIDYNGLIFMAESSELLIFINPEGSEIVNRYIH